MTKPNITTIETAECLRLLSNAADPIVAADLAGRLYLTGSRETQRRHVRAIVKQLRDNGSMIVATLCGGYFLTNDPHLWRDYLEGRQIDAKRVLGITHKRKRMLTDAAGQGVLFKPPRIACGVASMGVS